MDIKIGGFRLTYDRKGSVPRERFEAIGREYINLIGRLFETHLGGVQKGDPVPAPKDRSINSGSLAERLVEIYRKHGMEELARNYELMATDLRRNLWRGPPDPQVGPVSGDARYRGSEKFQKIE